jgi:transcriptional regulator with XRE-family HTH domain
MKKNLHERLRELRGELSQSEFCRKIGVPQTSYSGWEGGSKSPSANVIVQISNEIGVSADYLLGLSDNRKGVIVNVPSPETLAEIAELEAEIAKLNAALAEKDGIIQGLKMAFEAVGKGK